MDQFTLNGTVMTDQKPMTARPTVTFPPCAVPCDVTSRSPSASKKVLCADFRAERASGSPSKTIAKKSAVKVTAPSTKVNPSAGACPVRAL
jgi:hypothetical protein